MHHHAIKLKFFELISSSFGIKIGDILIDYSINIETVPFAKPSSKLKKRRDYTNSNRKK